MPRKPHSPRSTSFSSQPFTWDGTPSISLYEGITAIGEASAITVSKG